MKCMLEYRCLTLSQVHTITLDQKYGSLKLYIGFKSNMRLKPIVNFYSWPNPWVGGLAQSFSDILIFPPHQATPNCK